MIHSRLLSALVLTVLLVGCTPASQPGASPANVTLAPLSVGPTNAFIRVLVTTAQGGPPVTGAHVPKLDEADWKVRPEGNESFRTTLVNEREP